MKFVVSLVTIILAAIAKKYFDFYGLVIVCMIGGLVYKLVEKYSEN